MENVAETDMSEHMKEHGFRKKFLSFKGRIGRGDFFKRLGLWFSTFIVILIFARSAKYFGYTSDTFIIVTFSLAAVNYLLPIILLWRRLHDIGLPGWLGLSEIFLLYSPVNFDNNLLISAMVYLIIGVIPGTNSENKYGPKPE